MQQLLKKDKTILSPGFTVVELLVVIVVIGVLASIGMVTYRGVQRDAAESIVKSDLASAAKHLAVTKPKTGCPNDVSSIPKSNQTVYSNYSCNSQGFCLQAASSVQTGVPSHYINQEGKVTSGSCPTSPGGGPGGGTTPTPPPQPVIASAVISEVGTYGAYYDYVRVTVTWTSASPSVAPSYRVTGGSSNPVTMTNTSIGTKTLTTDKIPYDAQQVGAVYRTIGLDAIAPDGVTMSSTSVNLKVAN